MVDLVRETQPDLIITHHPQDYMCDHNELSRLVFDCSFHATLPLYETGKPHHATVTPIYYMDTIMGLGFQPTEYVDVSEVIDTKAAMLEAHAEPAHMASGPRRHRHRRADAGGDAVPGPPVRRRVRRGIHALPHVAARNDETSPAVKG